MNDVTNASPRRRWLKPAILAIFAGLTLSGCHYYADDPYDGPVYSGPVYSGSGYYSPGYYGPGYYRPVIVTRPRYHRGRYGVRRGGRATTRGRIVRNNRTVRGGKPPYRRASQNYKSPNW